MSRITTIKKFKSMCLLFSGSIAAHAAPSQDIGSASSGDISSGNLLVQFLIGFIIVILLIFILAKMMRGLQKVHPGSKGKLRILGAVSLGTRERAILVQVGKDQVLIGVAPGRVSRLHVIENMVPDEADNAVRDTGFANRLKQVLATRTGA